MRLFIKRIIKSAEKEAINLNSNYVGTEHLMLSLLKLQSIKELLIKYDITYEKYRNIVIEIDCYNSFDGVLLYTPLLRDVLEELITDNVSNELDVMKELLRIDDGIALRILSLLNVDINKLYQEFIYTDNEILSQIGSSIIDDKEHLIGREREIQSIINILLKKDKNNPILIGEAGVGKSAIVYEIAKRIESNQIPKLKGYKVISIDMSGLLTDTKYRGELESKINSIIKYVTKNKNIILFIDEIHNILKSGGGEGAIDTGNLLKPYLVKSDIKIIGATTLLEYENNIEKDKALSRRFINVFINEPNEDETYNILCGLKNDFEKYHNIKITNQNLKDIIYYSNKYVFSNHNPDKALDILDCVCSKISNENNTLNIRYCKEFLKNRNYVKALESKKNIINKKSIKKQDIIDVVESMNNIKVINMNLFKKLFKELDNMVETSLLKVEIASYFKNQKCTLIKLMESDISKKVIYKIKEILGFNLIELNMASYSNSESINNLIGASKGYVGYEDEAILTKVKYYPYSIIYLKNIECASFNVLNLFNSIAEEGIFKDKNGNDINFNNTIIFMTSKKINNQIGYSKNKNNTANIIKLNEKVNI